jgi:hypothetical protein
MLIRLVHGCGRGLLLSLRRSSAAPDCQGDVCRAVASVHEPPFDELNGDSTTSASIGGKTKNPTYEQASSGTWLPKPCRSFTTPRRSLTKNC